MVSCDLQKSELTAILKSCRRLSNILEIEELYTVFAELVKERFAIHELAIFMYDKAGRKLFPVSSTGLSDISLEISESNSGVWELISKGEPFEVSDDSGKLLYPDDFQTHNLTELQSRLWVSLGMKKALVDLMTIGNRKSNQPFK